MNTLSEVENNAIDVEWMALILEAKSLGLSKEDIRGFLQTRNIHK